MIGGANLNQNVPRPPKYRFNPAGALTISGFKQNWHSELLSNSQCTIYQQFKKDHSPEKYLKELSPEQAIRLSMFRMRVHHLPITKTRFSNAPVDINCPLCDKNETGDELHYLLKCPYFNEEREKQMPPIIICYRMIQRKFLKAPLVI